MKKDARRPSGSAIPRRRFLRLLAAGGAALAATGVPAAKAAPAPAKKAARGASPPVAPSIERELRNQEKSLAETLRVIRDYKLPAQSNPAVTFRAIRARREER